MGRNIAFKNITVLDHTGARCADVFISGDRIVEPFDNPETVIDGTNKIIMPGLVNAHTHVSMTILRSYADGYELHDWLNNYIFPVEDRLGANEIYWGAMLGIAEMLSGGTTKFYDMYFFSDRVCEAVLDTGIRADVARGLMCSDDGTDFSNEPRLLENIELFKNYNGAGGGRISVRFGPHAVYTCTPKFLAYVAETAKKLGAKIHVHLSETLEENRQCILKYKKTPTEYMLDAGVFDVECVAAHCVHLSGEDISILKEKNVTVAHNPTSNLKLGSGIAPINKLIKSGVRTAIGTDGTASNNNLNMFEEMHIASILTNGANMDPTAVSAKEVLKMATFGAELKIGSKADFIVLDVDKPHLCPMHNPLSNIVYSAQASDVWMTAVDGKILYKNGEYTTLDIEKVKYNVKKCVDKIFGGLNAERI